MRKLIALILITLTASFDGLILTAQSRTSSVNVNLEAVATKKISNIASVGDAIHITSVTMDATKSKGLNYIINVVSDKGDYAIDCSKIDELPFALSSQTDKDAYWIYKNMSTLPFLSKTSYIDETREIGEEMSNESLAKLKESNSIIDDPLLTDYIVNLFIKIYPSVRCDFFNYNFNVVIYSNLEPAVGMYPDGRFFITTGMLGCIHTEDELAAIISRECNHFVSNHFIISTAKAYKKMTIATYADMASSFLLGTKSKAYTELTKTSVDIKNENDKSQQIENDAAALDILTIMGYDTDALATYINNTAQYYIEEGRLSDIYNDKGVYPSLENRIANTGTPYDRHDAQFERRMATCVSINARMRYEQAKYDLTIKAIQQNIDNDIATGEDLCLYGDSMMKTRNTDESNALAADAFEKAIRLDRSIDAYKGYIMANYKLGDLEKARTALQEMNTISDDQQTQSWIKNMDRQLGS